MALGDITDTISDTAETVSDSVSDAVDSASDAASDFTDSGSDVVSGDDSTNRSRSGSADGGDETSESTGDSRPQSQIDQAAEAVAKPVQKVADRASDATDATSNFRSGATEATRRFATSAARAGIASAPAARSASNSVGETTGEVSEAAGAAATVADDPARNSAEIAATPLTREAGTTQTDQSMQTVNIDGVTYRVTDDGSLERASMTTSSTPDALSDVDTSDVSSGALGDLESGQQSMGQESRTDIGRMQLPASANVNQGSDNGIVDNVQSAADDRLMELTGGSIGISDDFSSMKDSGGPVNVLSSAATPVQEAGREFNRKRQQKGEQFGDADLSLGLGGPGDEIEQAAEQIQQKGSEVGRTVGDALFDAEQGAFSSESLGSRALKAAGKEGLAKQYESGIRNFGSGGLERLGEGAGSIPKIGVEGIEAAGFAANNPGQAVGRAPNAAAGAAVSTSRDFKRNPAEAFGGLVFGTAAGAGATRAIKKGRTAKRQGSLARTRGTVTDSRTRNGRTLTQDNRGQLMSGRQRGRADSESSGSSGVDSGDSLLPDNIDDMLNRMENADNRRAGSRRDANRRAEQKIIEKRLEEGRRQERSDEPRTVDTRPGGDYDAPSGPGGDYTAPQRPDTSRSGPTDAQAGRRSGLDTDLSPRESQLAAQLGRETPTADFRGVDATRRSTTTDLRVDAAGSSRIGAATGTGAAGGSLGLLEQAQQPQATGNEDGPTGTTEDTSIAAFDASVTGGLALLEDAQSGASDLLDDIGPTSMPTTQSPTAGTGTNTGTGVGTATGTTPGTDSGTDSGVDTGTDTGTRPGVDTGQEPDAGPISDGDSTGDLMDPVIPRDPDGPRGPNDRNPARDPDRRRFPRNPDRTRDPDRTRRVEIPDIDIGRDDDENEEKIFGVATSSYSFDFVDPLTGDEIATEEETSTNTAI